MNVELQINNSITPQARFVGWAPSPCRIRVTNPVGALPPSVSVELRSVSAAGGGAVGLRRGATGAFTNTITLTVPLNGTSVPFFVAGRFGQPSTSNGDVRIEARARLNPLTTVLTPVGSVRLMVRIRKNAERMTTAERDRFLSALAQLNNQGAGRFADFREHAYRRELAAGARRAGIPAVASCLPAGSRTRAAGDRSERLAALLALRSAGAATVHARLLRHLGERHRAVQRVEPAAVLGHRRRAGRHSRDRGTIRTRRRSRADRDHGSRRRWPRRRPIRPSASMEGNPHGTAHTSFGRVHLAASARRRKIRCSSCSTATSIGCGPSGSGRTAASIRRRPLVRQQSRQSDRPQP